MARLALALLALTAAACPAPAGAAAPKERFDAPGQRHAVVCARTAGPVALLRFGDAAPTGFGLTDRLSFVDSSCANGDVRLDLHELIPSAAGPLAFHRGGRGYRYDGDVKYGEVAASDLSGPLPAPTPSSGGRGAACAPAAGPAYRVNVRTIPSVMHYKRPQDVAGGSNKGTSFKHYGNPAADQGAREDIDYTYLLWSFVDVAGGGMVRTLLAPGQVVEPCDVAPATMSSWDSAGAVNGQVSARYVRVLAGTCPLHGWMVWDHTYYPHSPVPVAHATVAPGAAQPAPQPDAACPVAAPAAPPRVATGGAAAEDGSVTLEGTVDPVGTSGSYRFEYGTGQGYGAATVSRTLGAGDGEAPAVARLDGLAPGTYHYRLAATTVHGTSYGGDRRFEVAPRPAVMVGVPLPLRRATAVRALRVTPRAFHRARSRRGAPARIRLRLSHAAPVVLSFERRTRRGRWRAVPASLRRSLEEGSSAVRFGGWLGRRRVPPGHYRVAATAVSATGSAQRPRHARFRLRAALRRSRGR